MRPLAIIQCRLGSSRLPGKAALDMHGQPLLSRVIERCRMATRLSDIVVATSDQPQDDIIASIAQQAGAPVYRGSLNDVRGRMLACARRFGAKAFIRITADNPFVEPALIDLLAAAKAATPDCPYAVHDIDTTVYGIASELVDVQALVAHLDSLPAHGREHVTSGMANLTGALRLAPPPDYADSELSLTIDTLEQYATAWRIMDRFGNGPDAVPRIIEAFRAGSTQGLSFLRRS